MTLSVHEDIFGLEVAVNDVATVEAFERQKNLSRVEGSAALGEPLLASQVEEEFATIQEIHHKV